MKVLFLVSIVGFVVANIVAHFVLLLWMRTMMKWQRTQDAMILQILGRELETVKKAIPEKQ